MTVIIEPIKVLATSSVVAVVVATYAYCGKIKASETHVDNPINLTMVTN